MERKKAMVRETRGVAKATGLGLAVILLTSLTSAWAQQGAAAPAAQSAVASKNTSTSLASVEVMKTPPGDYTVSPEDLLAVDVLEVPEITREYRVSSNGFITLPLLPEPIPAAGETLDQLSHLIATKFREAGMLNNAQVTVSLKETRLHTVVVSGEVKNPQSYTVYGPTRLFDLLVKAGGLTDGAGDDAMIVRGDVGARADLAESARPDAASPPPGQSFTLNIHKLIATGDDTANILLYPGDRVTVQRAALVYILGAVNRPGGYVLNQANQQFTVIKALAMAGDVTNVAEKEANYGPAPGPGGPGTKAGGDSGGL